MIKDNTRSGKQRHFVFRIFFDSLTSKQNHFINENNEKKNTQVMVMHDILLRFHIKAHVS